MIISIIHIDILSIMFYNIEMVYWDDLVLALFQETEKQPWNIGVTWAARSTTGWAPANGLEGVFRWAEILPLHFVEKLAILFLCLFSLVLAKLCLRAREQKDSATDFVWILSGFHTSFQPVWNERAVALGWASDMLGKTIQWESTQW